MEPKFEKYAANNADANYLFGYGAGYVKIDKPLDAKLKSLGYTEANLPTVLSFRMWLGFACCGTATIGGFSSSGFGVEGKDACIEAYMKAIDFACKTLRSDYKKGLVYATVRDRQEDNRILTALLRSGFKVKSFWLNPNSGNAVISLEKVLDNNHESFIEKLVEQYK